MCTALKVSDTGFASWAVKLNSKKSAEQIKKDLRELDIPIIGFIEDGSFFVHLASVPEYEDAYLVKCLTVIL